MMKGIFEKNRENSTQLYSYTMWMRITVNVGIFIWVELL